MPDDRALGRPTCDAAGAAATSIEDLNRSCYCLTTNLDALKYGLQAELQRRGLRADMTATHPHLFASAPMFISRAHLEGMARVIGAVEAIVATSLFRAAALAWAPPIASFDPGLLGGLLGYDLHLTAAGPQLIEINTNPGGALLNVVLGQDNNRAVKTPGSPWLRWTRRRLRKSCSRFSWRNGVCSARMSLSAR